MGRRTSDGCTDTTADTGLSSSNFEYGSGTRNGLCYGYSSLVEKLLTSRTLALYPVWPLF